MIGIGRMGIGLSTDGITFTFSTLLKNMFLNPSRVEGENVRYQGASKARGLKQ